MTINELRSLILPSLVGTLKAGDPRNALLPHNRLSRRARKMLAACQPRPPRFPRRTLEAVQPQMGIRYVER